MLNGWAYGKLDDDDAERGAVGRRERRKRR
jgi:hypothetical protein